MEKIETKDLKIFPSILAGSATWEYGGGDFNWNDLTDWVTEILTATMDRKVAHGYVSMTPHENVNGGYVDTTIKYENKKTGETISKPLCIWFSFDDITILANWKVSNG